LATVTAVFNADAETDGTAHRFKMQWASQSEMTPPIRKGVDLQ
jgi:hypothetical protein